MLSKQELESIQSIAEAVISEIAPAEKPYFPVVWEEFLAQATAEPSPKKKRFIAGLFVDRGPRLKLASPLAVLVIAEVCAEANQHFGPLEVKAIRAATIAAAQQLGLPDDFINNLAESAPKIIVAELGSVIERGASQTEFPQPRDRTPECVAWYREPGADRLKRCTGKPSKLRAQFLKLQGSRFTIFVDCLNGEVWVLKCSELVSLQPRQRNLLALLLLHFGRRVPSIQAVRWAWSAGSHIKYSEDNARENLKGVVGALRNTLSSVKSFTIPYAGRGEGYYCTEAKEGECSFCILLPGEMDDRLKQVGLYPAVD